MIDTTGTVTSRKSVSRGALVVFSSALLLLLSLLVGYFYGRELARQPLDTANRIIQELQPENRRLQAIVNGQNTEIATLQARVKSVESALREILPTENTYKIGPNQTVLAADGRLVLGLVGPPMIRSVAININGKQYSAVSGDIFNVDLNASTACEVKVLSFDMFSAIMWATCKPKPQ